jgi:signal transduction histidine kinase
MATPLKLLILEDNALDAELEVRQLQAAGYDCGWLRVQTREEFEACLERSKRWAAQQLLRDAHGRLRTLSARLLQVEETERGRIARELHNGVGQLLTAVKLRLAGLNPSSADYASLRNECVGAIDEALEQVRRM